ncbi:DUF4336 domain-containing protein [Spirulina sp. CS-785/01]|uniref:DUF4336 domain-containing protein n=1 Tax=Spirulina sp. CS-785/01 TaxID=3021716 RepID=UPI00232F050C|nr:DUF4336 domain-containing protein [Spirulina sp. CS-785/01]MDB9314800.1 DUF4336 domain-containing protein [Spirulina sp. CS-785/01]
MAQQSTPRDWSWPFWPVVPLYPYGKRRTLRQEVLPDTLWTFDQLQGIFYVTVPVRMTVVRLEEGGLLVYAPVAPTPECVRLMRELEEKHGEVKVIVLPTVSGIEHKVFVGPFARKFPQAQVYIAPNQWSFPLNLPLSWLGFPRKRTHILSPDTPNVPYGDQFEYAILGPVKLGLGPFEEVALFHKPSQSLLVTDTVVSIPATPPDILQLDPYPLLFYAKDDTFAPMEDTPENRQRGWERIALFSMYFRPSAVEIVDLIDSIKQSFHAPDRSKKAYFGVYPFKWTQRDQLSFESLRRGGRLLVAPILQKLILGRAKQETLQWVERVAGWPFQRIVPCHLTSPILATPEEFRQAFAFLMKESSLPEADLALLQALEESFSQRGIL